MPNDIYSKPQQDLGGTFSADGAAITFSMGDASQRGVGLLTQNIGVNYSQQIARLYEIGTNLQFFVVGRAEGSCALQRVLGPRPVQVGFYSKFGDACNAAENHLDFLAASRCNDANQDFTNGSYAFTMRACVITNFGLNVGAGDMIINESLQMMFVALNFSVAS